MNKMVEDPLKVIEMVLRNTPKLSKSGGAKDLGCFAPLRPDPNEFVQTSGIWPISSVVGIRSAFRDAGAAPLLPTTPEMGQNPPDLAKLVRIWPPLGQTAQIYIILR